jgi:hypothetical protein
MLREREKQQPVYGFILQTIHTALQTQFALELTYIRANNFFFHSLILGFQEKAITIQRIRI